MKKSIGSYEAKTHFSNILEQVAKGDTYTITKRGQPIAVLSPLRNATGESLEDTVKQIRELRKDFKLKPLSLKKLVSEGRE